MPIFAHLSDSMLAAISVDTPVPASIPTLGVLSPVMVNMLIGVFLLICVAMILLVLIQRPQGGGLSGAFGAGGGGGGGGAGQTAFGTKTGDVLTWATIGIFVAFVFFAIFLNFEARPGKNKPNETTITAPAGATDETGADLDAGDGAIEEADEEVDEEAIEEAGEEASNASSEPAPASDG